MRQKSRDFYWYSPILKRELESVTADIVVSPTDEDGVAKVLAAAYRLGIPVTPRGSGTGNYGQAMPLAGGVVLNLAEMKQDPIDHAWPRRLRARRHSRRHRPGRRAASGQELRMFPSTRATASIGGFVAGGSGGVGSITWGGLRDFGNVLQLRVLTMEATPRALELTGEDLHKAVHAYGTNGIIIEVEMPLTASYDWVDVIVGFDTFDRGLRLRPRPRRGGRPAQEARHRRRGAGAARLFPAPSRLHPAGKERRAGDGRGRIRSTPSTPSRGATAAPRCCSTPRRLSPEARKGLPPNYELAWNHTTLRALRVDPAITYLQARYPHDNGLEVIDSLHRRFGDEVIGHLEFIRFNGRIGSAGLPLVRFTTPERLEEIIAIHEDVGAMIFNPHRYTLEEGGMKQTDAVQLAFKRETDPLGLLNPGKMIAWENPDFDYSEGKNFLFPGLEARALAAEGA